MNLDFKPAKQADLPIAYSFLRDALHISFGDNPALWPNDLGNLKEHNYIEIIQKKMARDSNSLIHIWQGNKIIGQIESSVKKEDPRLGNSKLENTKANPV